MKIALVRGAFLNQYEAQLYYPLTKTHEIVGFCSLRPIHEDLPFKVVKSLSPMDINFGQLDRFKMPILNRLFIDAHLLFGLENKIKGFDIAHCADTFYYFTHQCVEAKKRGIIKKVVATIFENIPFNNEGIWGRKKFKREAIKEIDHFIAISNRSKETLVLEGADENKITVIGQRIDTTNFKPARKLNASNKITILFAGRLEFYKGIFEIVYAAKRLISDRNIKNFQLKFKMVGDGSQKGKLNEIVKRLEIDRYFEILRVPYYQMGKMYNQADIFVAPSRATPTYQEQFSTVLLEAQACGLPIVTTYSGGIPENVEDAALMANPGDYYSLSERLKQFILNPSLRRYYSEKARKHVLKYDIVNGSKEVEKVYFQVLGA